MLQKKDHMKVVVDDLSYDIELSYNYNTFRVTVVFSAYLYIQQ